MTAHRVSDNTAIEAADQAKWDNACAHLRAVTEHCCTVTARRETGETLMLAWKAVHDEYVKVLERKFNRAEGGFGRADAPSIDAPPLVVPAAVVPAAAPHTTGSVRGNAFARIKAGTGETAWTWPGNPAPLMPERGERPLNHINRAALAEMGKADGEELYPNFVCGELDDGA
jgi:hypothetical protein